MTDTSNDIAANSNLVTRLCDGIAYACLVIAALALMSIVAINGVNVVMRYVFGAPFSWAEELMLFLMILGVFSGAIAVTWRNLHIRIDTLVDRLAPATRRVLQVGASLTSIVVVGIVTVASFRLVSLLQSMDQRSDALQAPSWIPQSFVTIGLGMIAVMIAIKLVLSFRR